MAPPRSTPRRVRAILRGVAYGLTLIGCSDRVLSNPGSLTSSTDSGAQAAEAGGAGTTGGAGAGTLIYRRNSIASLPDKSGGSTVRLAVQILGLSNVEVLEEQPTGEFAASIVAGPPLEAGAARAPIGLAVDDMNGDGLDDLLVADTLGNWIAWGKSDGTFAGSDTDPLVQSFLASPDVSFMPTASGDVLVGGLVTSFEASARVAPATSWGQPLDIAIPTPWINAPVSPQFFALQPAGGGFTELVYVGASRLNLFDLSQVASGTVPLLGSLTQSVVAAPYLEAFASFDHAQVLSVAGCSPLVVGVGVFSNHPNGVPRQLERLIIQSATYATEELATPFDVVSLAVVGGASGDAIVGVIGEQGTSGVFAAYRVTGCDQWLPLGSVPTDFGWRSPPAPHWGEGGPLVPKTDGVQILGLRATDPATPGDNRYRFLHYDGYDVRLWEVGVTDAQPPTARFTSRKSIVHTDRTDLAF